MNESEEPRKPERARRDARFYTRLGLGALATAAVIWFAVANSQHVSVDWFVVTTESRLIFVIILSAVLGALADRLIRWHRRRGR